MPDKPIRVAHVIGKLNAAGVEAVVNNFYRNIDHSKYQFDYFIDADSNCEPPQELIDMGARYFIIPPYQKLFQHIKELTRLFKENKYQIVHSGMNTLAPISMYCAWKASVPVRINHNHSTAGKGETKKNILKYCLRPFAKCFATDYCACSEYAGEWLFGKRMMKQGKVTVFKNAIDLDKFKYNEDIREEVRNELGISDKFVVGHVGRFCFQKNHDFLIDVFNEVHKENKNSVLLLVGIGELQEKIKEKVKRLGLTESVIFLNARKDVQRLYQAMDVFCFPSVYEGLGMVAIEAQASGLAVIASKEVPEEAIIRKSSIRLDLNDSQSTWKNALNRNISRISDIDALVDAGYDITRESKKLESYYSTHIIS